jgi:hypothetical protein
VTPFDYGIGWIPDFPLCSYAQRISALPAGAGND